MKREDIILNEIVDKHVLDIGSVGQTSKYSLWNQYQSVEYKSLTGIDIDLISNENIDLFGEDALSKGFDIVAGNMETHKFGRKFDVIIAGDVIEHVNNQGNFLVNVHQHLEDGGKFILTTPNAKWPTVFLEPNPTHTLWHDIHTLSRILNMNNFRIKDYHYYYGNKKSYFFPKNLFAYKQSLLFVCEKNI